MKKKWVLMGVLGLVLIFGVVVPQITPAFN